MLDADDIICFAVDDDFPDRESVAMVVSDYLPDLMDHPDLLAWRQEAAAAGTDLSDPSEAADHFLAVALRATESIQDSLRRGRSEVHPDDGASEEAWLLALALESVPGMADDLGLRVARR